MVSIEIPLPLTQACSARARGANSMRLTDPAHAPHHNILPVEENSSSETWKTATIEEWLRTPDQDRRRITHEERRKASFHLCHAQLNNIPAQQRRLIGVMYDTGSVPKPHQQQPAESFTRPTKKKQRKTKGKKSDQVLQVRDENCAMLNVNKLREGHGRSRYVITEKHLQDNDYTKAPISVNLPMMLPEGMFHATLPRTASFQQSLEGIYVGTGAEEQSRKLVIERQEQSHPYGRIHIIRQVRPHSPVVILRPLTYLGSLYRGITILMNSSEPPLQTYSNIIEEQQ